MDFAVKKLLDQATEKKPPWFERQANHRLEIWTYAVSMPKKAPFRL
jgi:hypothetical protein